MYEPIALFVNQTEVGVMNVCDVWFPLTLVFFAAFAPFAFFRDKRR